MYDFCEFEVIISNLGGLKSREEWPAEIRAVPRGRYRLADGVDQKATVDETLESTHYHHNAFARIGTKVAEYTPFTCSRLPRRGKRMLR